MKIKLLSVLVLVIVLAMLSELTLAETPIQQGGKVKAHELFSKLQGKWSGKVKTWFEPDKLADESSIEGSFSYALGEHFVRHNYTGSMQGKPRSGEELITFNTVTHNYQVAWFDSFHMNYAILDSIGPELENGFAVTGSYDVGDEQPQWHWRTEYRLIDDNNLTITAFNIFPERDKEAKAMEIRYSRK